MIVACEVNELCSTNGKHEKETTEKHNGLPAYGTPEAIISLKSDNKYG